MVTVLFLALSNFSLSAVHRPCVNFEIPGFEIESTSRRSVVYKNDKGETFGIQCLRKTKSFKKLKSEMKVLKGFKKVSARVLSYEVNRKDLHTRSYVIYGQYIVQLTFASSKPMKLNWKRIEERSRRLRL